MKKIPCILVDDEQNNIDYLCLLLNDFCPDLSVLATANNAVEAVEQINQLQPAIVFLDIEMPMMNGFECLRKLEPLSFEVIFVTAHSHYALAAFDVKAIGYLTKPVEPVKLKQAVETAKERINQKQIQSNLFSLLSSQKEATQKLALPTQTGIQFINQDHLVYCESNGNYTWFHLNNSKKILVSRQLGEYEKLLPQDQFVRIHDQFLINLSNIEEYIRGKGGELKLDNGILLPVASRRKEEFLSRFDKWLKRA